MSGMLLPKVTVILRGYETKQVLCVVEQLVGTKVNSIEVASNSPHAMQSIAAARKEFGAEVHVGAGTVTNLDLAKQAVDAGAEFMLSPIMFTQEMFDFAKKNEVITVPAAFSPSEIKMMFDMGADIVKVFPAGSRLCQSGAGAPWETSAYGRGGRRNGQRPELLRQGRHIRWYRFGHF